VWAWGSGVVDEGRAKDRALIVLTGRGGCLRWVERLVAGLAVVAVKAMALIWDLAWSAPLAVILVIFICVLRCQVIAQRLAWMGFELIGQP